MSDKVCILCKHPTDDSLQFGEKITCEDVTAHLYCLLLTSNLVQNGNDDEGIIGFLPIDIKREVSRTKKLFCHYCHSNGATIGCCKKSCRHSFHLPCALQNDCRFEFQDPFQSYCDAHHNIKKPKNAHKPSDLCTICYEEMGEYNPVRSIPLPCCNKNSWCHKLCLQQYAQTSGYFLKCPLCKDSDTFREWITRRGVFIPDRDAKWEGDENGPNSFYGFEHHSERPTNECEAEICRCPKGRKYLVDSEKNKYSMLYCDHCGSHAIHLGCFTGKDFLCDECTAIEKVRQENAANLLKTQTQKRHNDIVEIESDTEERFGSFSSIDRMLIAKYKLREFSICLRRLTAKDLGFKLEPSSSKSDITDSNDGRQTNDSFSDIQTSSSDESVINIQNKRSAPSGFDSDSDDERDLTPKPAKRTRILPRNQFFDSDDDEDLIFIDINDNSKDIPSSNLTITEDSSHEQSCKQVSAGLRVRQLSSSEDDNHIKPTNSKIQTFFDTPDEQMIDKENERPSKSIAVVRPFSRIESSADDNIKPDKLSIQSHPRFSSTDEPHDNFTASNQMEIGDNLSPYENQTVTNYVKQSPAKRKQHTVSSYFRDTTSSDEEPVPRKIRKKSPKKPRAQLELAPNQSTIIHFFKKQSNQTN
ncbi:G2/M phase-specific E3 ubiquitin-protein ligase-like [Contarinia nasturtii]|uniref:G2/M phase-specific E3 ubiquitin-protein ligase-like n=1 Tax=Contarinia nasturtii TaxID=265458 RepID=UPI0012D3C67D|nr:G2/M phase-specific E3 ubiquitin-protein ligase-like [Contarinia nasturtii]